MAYSNPDTPSDLKENKPQARAEADGQKQGATSTGTEKETTKASRLIIAGLTVIATVLGTIVVIITNASKIQEWIEAEFPKDAYKATVLIPQVVATNLYIYYIDRNLGETERLHFFLARIRNSYKERLAVTISFELYPASCNNFVHLTDREPIMKTVEKGRDEVVITTPKLVFNNGSYDLDCTLQINYIIQPTEEERKNGIRTQQADAVPVELLPLHTIDWELKNVEKRPVSFDLILSSLAGWTLAGDRDVVSRAKQLRPQVASSSRDQWVSLSYNDLFRGRSGLEIIPTDRTYPFKGRMEIETPKEILADGKAEPLEASLTLAALIHAAARTHGPELTIFLVPQSENKADLSVFLAWQSGYPAGWKAVDLKEAGSLTYEQNVAKSSAALLSVLQRNPGIESALNNKGVFASSEPGSPTALSIDRAIEQFHIGRLELPAPVQIPKTTSE